MNELKGGHDKIREDMVGLKSSNGALSKFLAKKAMRDLDVTPYLPLRTDDEVLKFFSDDEVGSRLEKEASLATWIAGKIALDMHFPSNALTRILSEWFRRLHYWPSNA